MPTKSIVAATLPCVCTGVTACRTAVTVTLTVRLKTSNRLRSHTASRPQPDPTGMNRSGSDGRSIR